MENFLSLIYDGSLQSQSSAILQIIQHGNKNLFHFIACVFFFTEMARLGGKRLFLRVSYYLFDDRITSVNPYASTEL